LLFVVFFLSGCIKDTVTRSYTYKLYQPVYQSMPGVRANIKSSTPAAVKQPGKLFIRGNYIFLNEVDKGIHVIDNSNPASPQRISFINIPGNIDMAVKGSYLYADSYNDIVVFDITNPKAAVVKKYIPGIFPGQGISYPMTATSNPDSIKILVDYVARDTTVDCDTYRLWTNCTNCARMDAAGGTFFTSAAPAKSIGGSMARLALVNDYLYGVSFSDLYSFNIAEPANPQLQNRKGLGWNIETVYPYGDKLFIGSTTGMFIYSIATPANPTYMSRFAHANSCDPVITDGKFAFVTLRSGTECQTFTNQLDILDISNANNPVLKKTYPLTNPHGLSKDGNLLFICDGKAGLRMYDATDVMDLKLKKMISDINAYDVILQNGIALVVAENGLYQYDYSVAGTLRFVSRITIAN
jgi:hypothetical protein